MSAHAGQCSASAAWISIMPLMLQAAPMLGNDVLMSTRFHPKSAIRPSMRDESTFHIAGEITAPPQSGTTATRFPRNVSRNVPSRGSHGSVSARLNGSRASRPAHTSNQRAVSRTLRDTHPAFTVRLPSWAWGARGMRPNVAFRPTKPVNPAGIRMDPPPSPAVANVTRPPATAAALPPEEPPGVRPCRHGLCVAPFSTVRVTFTPPNSLAVVRPASTAPAS
ncbi:unannotated protein [freshwater metagenome]|uniref:Unannotated protein n=1 Tax=freshwater metagenome TaxID=449393 RepID=A0A6J6E466_9ZZZZ